MVMSDSKSIDCELTVIGTGMAGNAAALFAVNRGLSTVQVGCTGEIVFASGFLDLFGVHPLEEKRIWQNPWEGIDAVVKAIPNHPYARVKTEEIRKAFKEFLFFKDVEVNGKRQNIRVPMANEDESMKKKLIDHINKNHIKIGEIYGLSQDFCK